MNRDVALLRGVGWQVDVGQGSMKDVVYEYVTGADFG